MRFGNTANCRLSSVTRRWQTQQNRNGRQSEQQMSCGKLVFEFFFFSFWTWNYSRRLGRCFVWIVAAGRPAGRKDEVRGYVGGQCAQMAGLVGRGWDKGSDRNIGIPASNFDLRLLRVYSGHRLVPSWVGWHWSAATTEANVNSLSPLDRLQCWHSVLKRFVARPFWSWGTMTHPKTCKKHTRVYEKLNKLPYDGTRLLLPKIKGKCKRKHQALWWRVKY